MKTLFSEDERTAFARRIDLLQPDSTGQWGKMDAAHMICHVTDQLRVALGDIPTSISAPSVFRFRLIRRVVVQLGTWLPWPKGRIETVPEMLTTSPSEWDDDLSALQGLLDTFGKQDPDAEWAAHPMFGRLSGREWGALSWKHLDYHLRQFGV